MVDFADFVLFVVAEGTLDLEVVFEIFDVIIDFVVLVADFVLASSLVPILALAELSFSLSALPMMFAGAISPLLNLAITSGYLSVP